MAADGSGAAAQLTSGCGVPGSRGPASAGPTGAEPSLCSGWFCQGKSICPAPTGCWKVPLLCQSPALKMQSCRSDAARSAPALNPSGPAGAQRVPPATAGLSAPRRAPGSVPAGVTSPWGLPITVWAARNLAPCVLSRVGSGGERRLGTSCWGLSHSSARKQGLWVLRWWHQGC